MAFDVLSVKYHEQLVGAISFDKNTGVGAFQYDSDFIKTGIELSPLKMPLNTAIYSFPTIDYSAFKGLPGLVADSLPDDFGNAVLNQWIVSQGKSTKDISPLDRLQYTGKRGMGALTYSPYTKLKKLNASTNVHIDSLVAIAQEMLDQREDFHVGLNHSGKEDIEGMKALLSVGMSAGGARPKAVVAFDDQFKQVRSGQASAPDGFTHYLLKFDGVSEHRTDKETFGDPMGYGAMEYVYSLMARDSRIDMMPCKLLEEGNRRHFITQRFDRKGNKKIHTQTLNGLAHISYKQPGLYSYEELIQLCKSLGLSRDEGWQMFRRMVFNIVARNHDDHSKNFSFMLSDENSEHNNTEKPRWKLAPAYDIAYSYKPGSQWVNSHWMTLNGKRDNFVRSDFYHFARISPIFSQRKIDRVIDEIVEQVSGWKTLAKEHGVPQTLAQEIAKNLRLKW